MVSEDEANKARRQHGHTLMKQGVHAIGVQKTEGREGWHVVAYVAPGKTVNLPASLATLTDGGIVDVPVSVRRSESFSPE
jgi:hypothetical protein